MGKKSKQLNTAQIDRSQVSDLNVILLHPSHEGDHASMQLILSIDDERLAFNCGEGFQRMCSECNARVTKLSAVLLTSVSFRTCTGLPGSVISCAEASKTSRSSLSVIAPRGIGLFMNALASYSEYVLKELNLQVKELDACKLQSENARDSLFTVASDPVFSNSKVTVNAVLLKPSAPEELSREPAAKRVRREQHNVSQDSAENPGDADKEASTGAKLSTRLEPVGEMQVAVFVCVLSSKRGKFLPEKAKSLGVKPGPDFGKLAKGESVQTEAGDTVNPEMCMQEGEVGECIVVLECPSVSYIPALREAMPSLQSLMSNTPQKRVSLVFHVGPKNIVASQEYREVMRPLDFCIHVTSPAEFDARRHAPAVAKSVELQVKLNLLCPSLFPPPAMLPEERNTTARRRIMEPLPSTNGDFPAKTSLPMSKPGEPETALPQAGEWLQMHHLQRAILRPYSRKGLCSAQVGAAVDACAVADELRDSHPSAVAAAQGMKRIIFTLHSLCSRGRGVLIGGDTKRDATV